MSALPNPNVTHPVPGFPVIKTMIKAGLKYEGTSQQSRIKLSKEEGNMIKSIMGWYSYS